MTTIESFSQTNAVLSAKIIAVEKAALEKWNNGDPSGYLNLSANDVVYFDPFLERKLEGLEALTKLYGSLKGQIHVDKYEMINPVVQAAAEMAVLTFNLISYEGKSVSRWNCTEVYRLEQDGNWKIIQTHWSFVKPGIKKQ